MQFNGFLPDAQQFLRDLGENNNKDWFEQRRHDYETLILIPLRKLVMDLSITMQEIDPELELRPVVNKTISRIYRDTRFSKDKSTFRTNMWINFKQSSTGWHDMPSWWIELKPDGYTYGMGFYQASATTMQAFRDRIESNQSLFRQVIDFYPGRPRFRLEGEMYKRKFNYFLPEDIQKWYQRKNMYLICKRPNDDILYSHKLVDHIAERFRELEPLYHYWMEVSSAD
ncbi:MAG: DUF2461 domain-containing protein [Candidatus Marinimicrobia bacterium]|nr:DUF2461 domain-containing protein [Candidatus Neomarinimicrobiota bacterium]